MGAKRFAFQKLSHYSDTPFNDGIVAGSVAHTKALVFDSVSFQKLAYGFGSKEGKGVVTFNNLRGACNRDKAFEVVAYTSRAFIPACKGKGEMGKNIYD